MYACIIKTEDKGRGKKMKIKIYLVTKNNGNQDNLNYRQNKNGNIPRTVDKVHFADCRTDKTYKMNKSEFLSKFEHSHDIFWTKN